MILISSVTGALAVAAGAFGAHALKARLTADMLAVWNTAAHYHLIHAVVLLALALHAQATGRTGGAAFPLMLAGIVLFSGSLYAMALSGIRILGAITPIGGLCLIAGWVLIAWELRRA